LPVIGSGVETTGEEERDLPPHIAEAVRSIARLHAEHHNNATRLQHTLGRLSFGLAHPWFIGALTVAVAGWIGFNLLSSSLGHAPPDPPPFAWLGFALSLASLYMVLLVYATQRRDDQLAEQREQLTLELALLNEQKTAKLIELIEEFRRDIPIVDNREDPQAEAMARPVEPERVLEAIKQTHAEAERVGASDERQTR
jgi:uncharacterized membrane protein